MLVSVLNTTAQAVVICAAHIARPTARETNAPLNFMAKKLDLKVSDLCRELHAILLPSARRKVNREVRPANRRVRIPAESRTGVVTAPTRGRSDFHLKVSGAFEVALLSPCRGNLDTNA